MTDNATNPGPDDDAHLDDGVDLELDDQAANDVDAGGEDELEEFEFEGHKAAVPKALKELLAKGVLMQGDYTKKTQELAEQRKAHDAQVEGQKAEAARFTQYRTETVQLESVREQLKAFDNVDWAKAAQLDAEEGTQRVSLARIQMDQLKDQAAKLQQSLGDLDAKGRQAANQAVANAMASCEAAMAKTFPKWAEMKPELEKFAKAHGVSEQELKTSSDPRIWTLMHYAKLGKEAEQRAKGKSAVQAQQAVAPAAAVAGSRSPTRFDPASKAALNESPEKWAERRNKELEKSQRPARRAAR